MTQLKHFFISLITVLSFIFSLDSCKKEHYTSTDQINFSVSTDTLLFDTIFTNTGSITKRIKVRNHENEKIKLSQVYIDNSSVQTFKINVDGVLKPLVKNVEIYPNDSIFIFVEATIDPSNETNPFIINDKLVIVANDTEKHVQLVAWGQNAHYYYANNKDSLSFNHILFDTDTTLTNDLPHIFYSDIIVANHATLTIEPGTQLHLAHNVNLTVHNGGKLHINGSGFGEQRVLISGSRLDDAYVHKPGQWGVIHICQDAGDSWIKNADIKNGTIGCYLGGPFHDQTFDVSLTPKLQVENTVITNMTHYGLLLQAGNSRITNSEISDCGEIALFNYIGGSCEITHSTIANYYSGRNTVSMVLTNHVTDPTNNIQYQKPLSFSMKNSILYGSYNTELVMNNNGEWFDVNFNTCLIRAEEGKDLDLTNSEVFTDCIFNEDPLFIRQYEGQFSNYQVMKTSPVINRANPVFSGTSSFDLIGTNRLLDAQPDIGAYEFVE